MYICWFKDLNIKDIPLVGGKTASLGEMYSKLTKKGMKIPNGFALTAEAYWEFLKFNKLDKKIKDILKDLNVKNVRALAIAGNKARQLILSAGFPKDMEQEVKKAYKKLSEKSGKTNLSVAVRSSATAEDLPDASFAGQQETYLNVQGDKELMMAVKKCLSSLFTDRAISYRIDQKFKHEKVSISVAVQKMVRSDLATAGVMFTIDTESGNPNVILINAAYGLGEYVVKGRVTPDQFFVFKDGVKRGFKSIVSRRLGTKDARLVYGKGGGTRSENVKMSDQKKFCITEDQVITLAKWGVKIEEHYAKPQDIEFAIEGGEIYIVQTRPITTMENRVESSSQNINAEPILSGLGASPGIASGKIKIVKTLADLNKIKKGDILVTEMTNPDMVVIMQRASAIVTDEGGLTSHAAIVSREMGVPAVVGTKEATTKLKEEEIVTVDGFNGKIYKGKIAETTQKEILPVTAETKTKLKVIVDLPTFAERASKTDLKKVGLTRIEGIIAESGKHPQYFLKENKIKDYEEVIFNGVKKIAEHFEEVWVRTSDIRSDEFNHLQGAPQEKEANPMLGMHGIRYSLKYLDIFKAELNALKRISHTGKIIGVLLPQVVLVDEVKKTKEVLKEIGFENAKLGVMVETPAAVQMIREIVKEGIQFISFGTNDLTQFILAVDRGNPEAQYLYNEMNPAILYQLEYVIRICKKNNVETSICGQSGSRKEMVKFLVEKGIDSISVNADVAKEIADYIAELEKQIGEEPRKYNPEKKQENFIEKIVEEVKEEVKDLFKEKKGELIPETEENVEIIEESVEEESVEISDDETPEFDEEKIKEIEEVGEILDDKPEFSDELGIFR